jgi:copper homeostasis protein
VTEVTEVTEGRGERGTADKTGEPRILLEIACGDLRDAIAAAEGGADRLELCSALELDGLTPSLGTALEVYRSAGVQFVAMVRPRAGDFVYGDDEVGVMLHDAQLLLDAGANGIVVGCLTRDHEIDARACARFAALAEGHAVVFHRAFDRIKEPFGALEILVDLGFTRILTSGGTKTALEGVKRLRELVERADGRIQILPGGGIRENNVEAVVKQTGCSQVHLSRR